MLYDAIHRQSFAQCKPTWSPSVRKTKSHQYAAVMGLPKDLKLKGNDFTNAATSFFIAYLIAEIPNGKADNFFS